MESQSKRLGRPSAWNEELGKVKQGSRDYPPAIWDMIDNKNTKRVLNRMALDDAYRDRVWRSVED